MLATKYNQWTIENVEGIDLLFSPLLKEQSNLVHAFTTRKGGQTPGPYAGFNLGTLIGGESGRADALQNRQNLCRSLSIQDSRIAVAGQVHSANVEILQDPENIPLLKNIDGLVSCRSNLTLMLHFADCVPVIVYDRHKNVAGIFHAGWRGTAQSIVVRGLESMQKEYACQPQDMLVAIGPAIGPCCYPVGKDAADQLGATVKSSEGLFEHRNADSSVRPDLKGINARQLEEFGVRIENIDICSYCTACSHDIFYSHRASGGTTGRQGALIHLK